MSNKPAKSKTGKSTINNPALSGDEFDLPKAQRLDNAYAKYLRPDNTKSKRKLSLEHKIARSSLKERIKGEKARSVEDENRQRLTYLEEEALQYWCLQLEA
jgi:hypothetical protein